MTPPRASPRSATSSSCWVVADYDLARAERTVAAVGERHPGETRFVAAQVDASSAEAVTALAREHGGDARLQRRRPEVQHADLQWRQGCRGRLPRHGHEPVAAPSRAALRAGRRHARRRAVRRGGGVGGRRPPRARRHRRRARALRRLRPVCRRPPLRRDRRARHARRRQPRRPRRRGQRDLRAELLDVDDDRGVPQPSRRLGEGPRLVHDRALQRAGGLRLPRGHRAGRVRQRRARGGAPHAALGRRQAGHLQVRPRRRVHHHPQGAEHPRPRPHRADHRQGRAGLAARRRGRCAARPGDHRARG